MKVERQPGLKARRAVFEDLRLGRDEGHGGPRSLRDLRGRKHCARQRQGFQLVADYRDRYGEVELAHRYEYHGNCALSRAEITMLDEDGVVLYFE